ncbi:MAG: peroxidase-related enzyme [Candidatus Acidiferrales bacterium]
MSFLGEIQFEDEFGPYVAFQAAFGFVPNLVRAQTLLPRVIEAQAGLESAVRLCEGAIPRIQRERILLSIAADRGDEYCMAVDAKVMSSLGVPEGEVDDFLDNVLNARPHAGFSQQDLASLQFCRKLARNASSVSAEDIDALRACGLEDESIVEAVATAALAVYRCTLSAALKPAPDFPPRRPISRRSNPPSEETRIHHEATRRKGPYVPAPYLSPSVFAPFGIIQKTHGFIPNFFRAQTLRPDLLQAELEAVERILAPEDILTRVQKECILLAVSAANLNSYCVAVHCNLLRGLGMSPEDGDQIAVDHHESSLPAADKALLDFAVKLGGRGSEFSGEDVAKLRAMGFSDPQILECAVVTALNNFSNTLQMGLGIEPDFEPPLIFERNKVNLSAAAQTPIAGEGGVHLVEIVQDVDAEQVAQAQGGNLEAFEELVRRHSQLIYRTLAAILGNPADAQDAMQDTLLSAFKHLGGFQGRSKFSTWLVSIARNSALQRLRRGKPMESLDEGECDDEGNFRPRQVRAWQDDPEECHSKSEMRQLVERGILALPARYRVVVMLRDIQQLSTDEVAQQLGLSVPAVKTRLLRGRLMLREWLSPHFSAAVKGTAQ